MSKYRFLIAEDSEPMRRLIRSVVADLAKDIVECNAGRDAVRAYFETRPDWVLMDLQTAGGDGLEATREIHDIEPGARIVIVTQLEGPELRQAAAEAGAVAYVLKENLLALRRIFL
jgi:two-component system chemotaxis response regulator CheY